MNWMISLMFKVNTDLHSELPNRKQYIPLFSLKFDFFFWWNFQIICRCECILLYKAHQLYQVLFSSLDLCRILLECPIFFKFLISNIFLFCLLITVKYQFKFFIEYNYQILPLLKHNVFGHHLFKFFESFCLVFLSFDECIIIFPIDPSVVEKWQY